MDTIHDADLEKATLLMKEIHEKSKDASEVVKNLCTKAEDGAFNTSKGISFLEMKYQLLLSYLINLTYIMLEKVNGMSLVGDATVERLVEIRTVLEKIRPIDQKLKYQIDKVVQAATTGAVGDSDPMRFKARPDNLESKIDGDAESGSEEDEEGEEEKKSKVYRPPKLAAVHYDAEETTLGKQQRQQEEMKKRALNSDLMRELKEQYSDAPIELRDTRDIHRLKEDKRSHERQSYEEENFVRLSVSKREKHAMKRMATMSALGDLTRFDAMGGLDLDDRAADMPSKKRKFDKMGSGKKGKGKGKGKKKGFKRKRHH